MQGPLQSHGVAGRVFPWASSAAILTRSYRTFAAIGRCGTPAAGAPRRHHQSATSSKPSVAYGPACECAFGVHAITTPSLAEIHNDYMGQFREHSRPRSAQCAVRSAQCVARARSAEPHANSPRVCWRAPTGLNSLTPPRCNRHYSPEVICRR